MQEAQKLYEQQKERADEMQNQSFASLGEYEGLKSQMQAELQKAYFDIEELKASNERLLAENNRLSKELSDLSGDGTTSSLTTSIGDRRGKVMEAGLAADMDDTITITQNPMSGANSFDHMKDEGRSDVVELDLEGHRALMSENRRQLAAILERLNSSPEASQSIMYWADSMIREQDKWCKRSVEKFAEYDREKVEHNKKIREMEVQRSRLEKDLLFRTERVCYITIFMN